MDYNDAATMLGERQRLRMRGRFTVLERACRRSISLRYHSTVVIKWWADGRVRLDTGGWRTVTTKRRFAWYSEFAVWSRRGQWFVRVGGEDRPFIDGMIVGGPVR